MIAKPQATGRLRLSGLIGTFFQIGVMRAVRMVDTTRYAPGGATVPRFYRSFHREGPPDMAVSHLKIYDGPSESLSHTLSKSSSGENCITVSLGEVLPLLVDAARSERTWLSDFEEDDITISTDLFEVLMSYQYFRRPAG